MLVALGLDPAVIKTEAGKCILARFAFANNLAYIRSESSELIRALNKDTIASFKAFQKKYFVAWAGTKHTKPESIQSFYVPLIRFWEARALENKTDIMGNKTHVSEALEKLNEAVQYEKVSDNLLKDIQELAASLQNVGKPLSVDMFA